MTINTREVLKNFSARIWRIDRLNFNAFQTFIILVIDEISRSNEVLREFPDFVVIISKQYYKKFITIL